MKTIEEMRAEMEKLNREYRLMEAKHQMDMQVLVLETQLEIQQMFNVGLYKALAQKKFPLIVNDVFAA